MFRRGNSLINRAIYPLSLHPSPDYFNPIPPSLPSFGGGQKRSFDAQSKKLHGRKAFCSYPFEGERKILRPWFNEEKFNINSRNIEFSFLSIAKNWKYYSLIINRHPSLIIFLFSNWNRKISHRVFVRWLRRVNNYLFGIKPVPLNSVLIDEGSEYNGF